VRLAALAILLLAAMPQTASASASAATSSDGKAHVEIRKIRGGDEDGNGAQAIVYGERGRRERVLLVSKYDDDHRANLANLDTPMFSLDGGYIYFSSSDASPNRSAVHQYNVKTGAIRFVTGGSGLSVIRSGPYRGYILVQKHKYYERPEGGSYNPVFVVRPDGAIQLMVPGSDKVDGERAVRPWLSKNGWRAW